MQISFAIMVSAQTIPRQRVSAGILSPYAGKGVDVIEQSDTAEKWLLSARNQVLYQRPHVPEAEIVRLIGGRPKQSLAPRTRRSIERWSQSLKPIISPRLTFSTHRIAGTDGRRVSLENGATLRSAKLARSVSRCTHLVCFVGTIGKSIEERISSLSDAGRVTDAFVADAIGSVAVETMIDRFHQGIGGHSQGLHYGTSLRFSPGYCDWSVREQMTLFNVVNAKAIGVSLLSSALMTPRKSVSGVFGLSQEAGAVRSPYNPCRSCGNAGCFCRRETA